MMRPRSFLTLLSTTAAILVLFASSASAQSRDRVYYRDREKEGKAASTEGEVRETGGGVEVVDGVKRTKISAADMIRIDYAEMPGVDRSAQVTAIGLEDGRDPVKCAAEYSKLLKLASTDKAKRYLSFREAHWLGRAAGQKAGDDFAPAAKAAADKLVAFTKQYPRSWETWQTTREAARLYSQIGESEAALAAIKMLAGNTDLTADLLIDSQLIQASYLLRTGDLKGAAEMVARVAEHPKIGELAAQKDRLSIFNEVLKVPPPPPALVKMPQESDDDFATRQEAAATAASTARTGAQAAISKIETAIARAKDPLSRAVGYNLLGDLCLMHGLTRDAMWAYLWVDTVYNQDKDEQIKAITRLIEVFKRMKDEERTLQFEERLQKIR